MKISGVYGTQPFAIRFTTICKQMGFSYKSVLIRKKQFPLHGQCQDPIFTNNPRTPLHTCHSVCFLVGCLPNVPATSSCTSRTHLLRQVYVLPHWDRCCTSNFPPHPVTVYWHPANQSQHWAYSTRRLATGVPIFKSVIWLDPEKSWSKWDSKPGSSALKADTFITRPTRRSLSGPGCPGQGTEWPQHTVGPTWASHSYCGTTSPNVHSGPYLSQPLLLWQHQPQCTQWTLPEPATPTVAAPAPMYTVDPTWASHSYCGSTSPNVLGCLVNVPLYCARLEWTHLHTDTSMNACTPTYTHTHTQESTHQTHTWSSMKYCINIYPHSSPIQFSGAYHHAKFERNWSVTALMQATVFPLNIDGKDKSRMFIHPCSPFSFFFNPNQSQRIFNSLSLSRLPQSYKMHVSKLTIWFYHIISAAKYGIVIQEACVQWYWIQKRQGKMHPTSSRV